MSIPQPTDNERFKFISREQQVVTSSKIIELPRQKQKNTAYYVTCLLAAEAISYWLKPKKYPLQRHQVLKLLGIKAEAKKFNDDNGEEELIGFLEKQISKKSKSLAKYGEEINLLDDVKKSDSYRVGSLQNELKLRLDKLYTDYPVEIDVVEAVTEYFDFMENYLDSWYADESRSETFISLRRQLRDNSLILKSRLYTRLEDIILYGQKSSLKGSLNFLEELASIFRELEQEYVKESARYIEKENGCLRTYKRSLSKLKVREDGDSDNDLEGLLYGVYRVFKLKEKLPYYQKLMENFKIAKNNLVNLYEFKIEAEAYSQAIQVIKRLDSNNQTCIDQLKSSEKFLREMREDFLAEIKMEKDNILLPFLLDDVSNSLNPSILLKSVEEKVASPLLIWGSHRRIDQKMVSLALREELEPIAQKICSSTKEQLIQESQEHK